MQATAADAVAAGFATRVLLDLTAGVSPEYDRTGHRRTCETAGVEVATHALAAQALS